MIKKNKDEIIRIIKYLFSAGSSFILDSITENGELTNDTKEQINMLLKQV